MNWIYVMDDAELPEGQMTAAYPLGINVILACVSGTIYAISGKCAHMTCPLFTGKLEGYTVTYPMHCAQFDITNGEALSGPVPADIEHKIMSPLISKYMQNIGKLMNHVRMESIQTFATKTEDGCVLVEV